MRCIACGAEMNLGKVIQVQDDTTASHGIEEHSFVCSECHEVERRLIVTRHGREIDKAPPIVPASAVQDEHIVALLRRVLAKIRDGL
jgi:hypothetical protein